METIILKAIQLLNDVIAPVGSVELIDIELVRKYPDSHAKLGYLGATILVKCGGVKYRTFFRYQYAEDMFFGFSDPKIMADNFIWSIIDRDNFLIEAIKLMNSRIRKMRKEKIEKINEINK